MSETEWVVWLRQNQRDRFGPCGEPHDNPDDAADHAAMLHDLWPRGDVEIEEREVVIRTIQRRRVERAPTPPPARP